MRLSRYFKKCLLINQLLVFQIRFDVCLNFLLIFSQNESRKFKIWFLTKSNCARIFDLSLLPGEKEMTRLLPSYNTLKNRFPLTLKQKAFIDESRKRASAILNESENRLLLIVGPCSIHDLESAREYAKELKKLSLSVSQHFLIVMRTFFEKSRSALGWKGLLYDPFLDGSHEMEKGLELVRSFLIEMADLEIPTAGEFLDPITAPYYEDLVTWGSVGARTSSSQLHRQMASGLQMPIGIKNGTAGDINPAIAGIATGMHSHFHPGIDGHGQPVLIKTKGNPDLHLVLRGGESGPNFDSESVAYALSELKRQNLPERVIIDCSHQNSSKIPERQKLVFHSVLKQIIEGSDAIRGMMIESHLYEGNQMHKSEDKELKYGISITDPCLGIDETFSLIQEASHLLDLYGIVPDSCPIHFAGSN